MDLRHTDRTAYCCSLSVLTRFTGIHCAGPLETAGYLKTFHLTYSSIRSGSGLSPLRLLNHILYQFQIYDFCVVSLSRSELEDSGVTTISIFISRSDFFKQLCYNVLVKDIFEYLSPCVVVILPSLNRSVTRFLSMDFLCAEFLPSFL